jgi:uncharacterized UBP type Zn finger protein
MSSSIAFYNSKNFITDLTKDEIFNLCFPTKLTGQEVCLFKKNTSLRRKVVKVTVRFVRDLGYSIDPKTWEPYRVKKLDLPIITQEKISRVLAFLVALDMRRLSGIVFSCICNAVNRDKHLAKQVIKNGMLNVWTALQVSVKKNICNLRGLEWVGNSCYMDSALFALFAIPNKIITSNILKKDLKDVKKTSLCGDTEEEDYNNRRAIQKELKRLAYVMRGRNKGEAVCSTLRSLLSKCDLPQRFDETGTQDAGEFLLYLFSVFDVELLRMTRVTEVTNDLTATAGLKVSETEYTSSPVVPVSLFVPGSYKLSDFLETVEDATFSEDNLYKRNGEVYRRRIERVTVRNTPYIVFNVNRFAHATIDLEYTIGNLELSAIVVHKGNHYTAYVNCNGTWVFYNDISEGITIVNRPSGVERNGTLFFYT